MIFSCMVRILNLLLFVSLVTGTAIAATEKRSQDVALNEGWEFVLTDVPPGTENPGTWMLREQNTLSWTSYSLPGQIPNRNGARRAWYRVKLPDAAVLESMESPALFVANIDEIFEIYLEGEKIYGFSQIPVGKEKYEPSFRWHAIPIPQSGAGKHMYLRVYSEHSNIGVYGEAVIRPRHVILEQMLRDNLLRVVMACLAFGVSICSLAFWIWNRKSTLFLSGAAFFLCFSITNLTSSQLIFLLYNDSNFWRRAFVTAIYSAPFAIAWCFKELFGNGWKNTTNYFIAFSMGSAAVMEVLNLTGISSSSQTMVFANINLLLTVVYLMGTLFYHAFRMNRNALILSTGVILAGVGTGIDVLVGLQVLPWLPSVATTGIFALTVCLVIVLVENHRETQRQVFRQRNEIQAQKHQLAQLEIESHKERLRELGHVAVRLGDRLNNPLNVLLLTLEEMEETFSGESLTQEQSESLENLHNTLERSLDKIREEMTTLDEFKKYAPENAVNLDLKKVS